MPGKTSTTHKNRVKTALLIILGLGFVIWGVVFILRSSVVAIDGQRYFVLFDDAMISMRYAWNLSHGQGPVWNPGERIEGYTNFLMMLVMALATWFFNKSMAVLAIQILGLFTVLAIAYLAVQIRKLIDQSEDRTRHVIFDTLVFAGILFYYPLSYWSLMGMETGLVTLLLCLAVYTSLQAARQPVKAYQTAIFLGLAFWTRNETVLFASLIWLYLLFNTLTQPDIAHQPSQISWRSRQIKLGRLKSLLAAVGLYGLWMAGLLALRYGYYGELVPNTYYLKVAGMPIAQRIQQGFTFIQPFLIEAFLLMLFAILGWLLDRRRANLLLLALFGTALIYQVYTGGDAWRLWRMIVPTIPFLILLFIQGVATVLDAVPRLRLSKKRAAAPQPLAPAFINGLIIFLGMIGLVIANLTFLAYITHREPPYQVDSNQMNMDTSLALLALTTPEATVGVIMAGTIPYYTDRVAYDFLGKSDAYIAQLPADISGSVSFDNLNSVPGHNKYDLDYSIKELRPTYVQSLHWGAQDLSAWAEDIYVTVEYQGVQLILLAGSPDVHWELIDE